MMPYPIASTATPSATPSAILGTLSWTTAICVIASTLACTPVVTLAVDIQLGHGALSELRFSEIAGEREFTGQLIARPRQDLSRSQRAQAVALLAGYSPKRNARTDDFVITVGLGPVAPGHAAAGRGRGRQEGWSSREQEG